MVKVFLFHAKKPFSKEAFAVTTMPILPQVSQHVQFNKKEYVVEGVLHRFMEDPREWQVCLYLTERGTIS